VPRFNVPESFRPALLQIAAMSVSQVEELQRALESAEPTLNVNNLVEHIRKMLGQNVPDLLGIVQTLSNLNNARIGPFVDLSAADFASSVISQLPVRKDNPVDVAVLQARLVKLLETDSLLVSAKAFDVQHEYERLFIAARIVTDTRSVFDQAGTEILGTMIVHNLNIKYSENGQFKELVFALDDQDIIKLRRILDRAETKAVALEKLIAKSGVRYFDSK
jgi:hypothetical protein